MQKQEQSFLEYMENNHVDKGIIDGYTYFILRAPLENALNGYIVFPKRPVREESYNGILCYVPVHGGITLCRTQPDGSVVYGFDTLHFDSTEYPRSNKEWIKEQIAVMLNGILMAKKVELKYLKAVTNKGKAKYAQMVQDLQPEHSHNFGVSINLLSGKL